MALVAVTLLVVAGTRTPETGTSDDRLYAIAAQLKCLQCVGESAAASQAPLAQQFREEIRSQMATNATDDEILNFFADRYGDQVLLDPPSSGIGLLVWVLPVLVVGAAVVGLGFAFGRWRNQSEAEAGAELPDVTTSMDAVGSEAAAAESDAGSGAGSDAASDASGGRTPRWRPVAVGAGVVGFLVLTAWLVSWGTDDRGGGTLTGGVESADGLAGCQPLAMQEPAKGIECYDELLADSPDDVEALTYRGWAHVRAGDEEAGAADLARAVELDPTYPDARVFRAVQAADTGDFATASDELAVFFANDPSDVALGVVQSEGLERKIFFGLMSGPTRACWQQAAAGGDGDSIDQAFLDSLGTCLDTVLAAAPDDRAAELSRALAWVGPETADVEAARGLLDELLAEDPDDADALALQVSLDLAGGNLEGAAEGLEQLRELPRGPAAFLIGDVDTLTEAYDAALRSSLPNPEGG